MKRPFLLLLSSMLILTLLPGLATAKDKPGKDAPIDLQFLAVSDFHGQLDPLSVFGVGNVGGAATLKTLWDADRAANPNTLTLTAGDAVGASPPLSSFFQETPTVLAMNEMGFTADTLGNHNFDKGLDELRRLVDLAEFDYVSANLTNLEANDLKDVEPFQIYKVGKVKVAVIGITNPEAPSLVFPGTFGSIEITDPVAAANKARADAAKKGATVFVAITHMGITGSSSTGTPTGPLVDFANGIQGFDLVMGDHTDVQYQSVINGALVVENQSKGRTYSRATLTVDGRKGGVIAKSVDFVTPFSDNVAQDPGVVAVLQPFRDQLGPIFNEVVGSSNRDIPRSDSCGRSDGRQCESLVGNVVTDALRSTYGTDFALTNSGGLRASLTCPRVDNPSDFCPAFTTPDAPITRGQVFTVLPFGNVAVTVAISGLELDSFLEQGVSSTPSASGRFAQISGLCFSYDVSAAPGSRVSSAVRQAADGTCTGTAIDLTGATTYTLATNDFTASGGDGYPNVIGRAVTREPLDAVVTDYVEATETLTPSIQGRITCTKLDSSSLVNCSPITAP